jgi:hypothetical protein
VLAFGILPAQRAALAGSAVDRLAMTTGIFNLLWVTVTILMIVRPGSTRRLSSVGHAEFEHEVRPGDVFELIGRRVPDDPFLDKLPVPADGGA